VRPQLTVAIVLALLAGCATEARYRERLSAWEGASENDLVASWGVPDGFYEATDGTRFLTYRRDRTVYLPGTPDRVRVDPLTGRAETIPGRSGVLHRTSCETTFEIVADVVEGWSYRGNNCVAR